jgi:hypothetical protein
MSLAPQFLLARALRHRYLATKTRKLATAATADDAIPSLLELADKLEREAASDEQEAHTLQEEEAADTNILDVPANPDQSTGSGSHLRF